MDLSSEDRFSKPWFNKTTGSEFKYKFKPKWLFTTILVFTTDFWHLMQFFFLNTIILSIVFYKPLINPIVDFFLYSIVFRVLFELIYSTLKKQLKNGTK